MSVTNWNAIGVEAQVTMASSEGIRHCGEILEKAMKSIIGRGHGGVPSSPGQPPNSQTNTLRGQIRYEMRSHLEVAVGSGAFYGAVLERGGTIRAKKKMLMIPLSKEMKKRTARGERPANIVIALRFDKSRPIKYIKTKRGVMIVREVKTVTRSARSVKWGGPTSVGEADEPLFLMTPRVTIAPRPWMRPALERSRERLFRGFVDTARNEMRRAY